MEYTSNIGDATMEDSTTHMETPRTFGKLAAALAKAQGEIRNAKKDSNNPFFKSSYADLASVWDACREALSKNEIAVIQSPCMVNDRLCIRTKLIHSSGEWDEGLLPVAVPITAKAQEMGSAITYARRYSLQSMVGVAPEEGEDDDGNKATHGTNGKTTPPPPDQLGPKISEAQRKKLWAMMKEHGLSDDDAKSLFAFVGPTTVKTASAFIANFDQAIADWRKTTNPITFAPAEDMPDL